MTAAPAPSRLGVRDRLARDPYLTRMIIVLVALLAFFAIVKPSQFFGLRTWTGMAVQFPEFGIMALGVMITMFTAGIDLSMVSVANLTGIITAYMLKAALPAEATGTNYVLSVLLAVLMAVIVGGACGAFNGFLISRVKIPPILATLGTLELFGGIAIVISEGKGVPGFKPFSDVITGKLLGVIPIQLVVFLVCVAVIGSLLTFTGFGTKILMLGTNETAARFSGMKVTSLLMRTYILSGMLAGIAGVIMLATYNSAKAGNAEPYTLLTILIVVLGGVNPNGGKGRITGVILAILTLQILASGLNMFPDISNFYRPLIWGGVLLAIITMDEFKGGAVLSRLLTRKAES
ncbi:ABC transporter permease [Schaalia sp. Marseille-Q2122]|uniref:ABC transporter permease n=1 Tax=Schaalia sp. Marseille-Q2122 TaxID=2736604 RepID=UPI00158E16C5|nr:ABC transporter permease [Schaalia sp. Marseille-Q2122]